MLIVKLCNSITLDPKACIQDKTIFCEDFPFLKSPKKPPDSHTLTVPDFHGKLANVDDLNWNSLVKIR